MTEIVSLSGFPTSVFLRGDEGASIKGGATKRCVGDFRFVLQAFGDENVSRPITFGTTNPAAIVTGGPGNWTLSELDNLEFLFDERQVLRASDRCPTLEFSRVNLWQLRASGGKTFPAVVEMPDMAISLRPKATAPLAGTLHHPSVGGWTEAPLRESDHPEIPGLSGLYLRAVSNGLLAAYAATPVQRIDLDHTKAVRLFCERNTRLAFAVEGAQSGHNGCVQFEALRPEALSVGLNAASGLTFEDQTGDEKDFTWKALDSVEARRGFFSDAAFSDRRVRITKWSEAATSARPAALEQGGDSYLFGRGADFDLALEIQEETTFDPAKHRAAFVYRAPEVSAAAKLTDPWERFHGLSIAGLSSLRGRQEVLDVSLAELALRPAGQNGVFEVKAGGEIPRLGASVVLPKPDANAARRFAIATDGMQVLIDGDAAGADRTMVEYRSESQSVTLVDPVLEVPPAGAAAKPPKSNSALDANTDPFGKARFRLPKAEGASGRLGLKIVSRKLVPEREWVSPFRTETNAFEMLEVPGVALEIKGPSSGPIAFDAASPDTGSTFDLDVEWPSDTKKVAVFSVASLAAAWYAIPDGISESLDEFRKDGEDFFDTDDVQVEFDFTNMSASDLSKFVASRATDSLQVGYFAESRGDSGHDLIKEFVDANVAAQFAKQKEPRKPIKKFYMPLDVGLSVMLMDITDDPDASGLRGYATDIMFAAASNNEGAPSVRPSMLFKLSQKGVRTNENTKERIPISLDLLGYDQEQWKKLAEDQPGLWPRASQVKGGKPDPTDPRWIGIFLRDMPIQLVAPPKVEEGILNRSDLLKAIYTAINENLFLRYGWVGPKGAAWFATLLSPNGYDITPAKWKSDILFRLERVSLAGAEGKSLGGEAQISLALLKITDDAGDALTVEGTFGVSVEKADAITRFELAVTNSSVLTTNAIPGFEKVELVGLSSDFVTATVKIKLTPSTALASALPIFDANRDIEASVVLNFSGEPGSDLQVALPTDTETNLFGRFPLTIQGVYLKVRGGTNNLLIRGRLGLGLVGLESVGADIVLKQTDVGWDFDIYINEIGISLDLGDEFRIKGLLSWAPADVPLDRLRPDGANPKRYNKPISSSELATEGRKRDFWGILMLETGGLMGNLTVLMKAGSKGERTYWVAAVESDQSLGMGSASFEQPAIVLAKNADLGTGLEKLLLDPYNDNVKGLRPKSGDLEAKREWITSWRASESIGTVVAGSGYLHLADGVAESPAGQDSNDNNEKKYLTALVATDSGLFRLDAQARLLGTAMVGFGIAIDTRNKNLLATIRLPEIVYPSEKNPKYVISPGTMALGISYGGAPYFLLSIGWPPLIEGSSLERDWSQSTRVYIAEIIPINTFWGGYRAILTRKGVRFGFAIRAGWTWTAELYGADIAKASAELGVTLGGVLEFQILTSVTSRSAQTAKLPENRRLPPPRTLAIRNTATFSTLDSVVAAHISKSLSIMEDAVALGIRDVEMEATLYGDIWGKGSVEFLGVTLASIEIALRLRVQVCGTLQRGITRAWGRGEIEVKVTILCVEFIGYAGFDLWLKRGPYPCLEPLRSQLFAPQPAETAIDLLPLGSS